MAGFSCDDDEMSWWQFGPSTQEALRCYQVSAPCPCAQQAACPDACTLVGARPASHRPPPSLTALPHTPLPLLQASQGLPETGVADERTWRALLGPEAQPSQVYELASEDTAEFTRDRGASGGQEGMWLVGEQRWSY